MKLRKRAENGTAVVGEIKIERVWAQRESSQDSRGVGESDGSVKEYWYGPQWLVVVQVQVQVEVEVEHRQAS